MFRNYSAEEMFVRSGMVMKNDRKAKQRDINFVFEISERAMELQDDEELSQI